MMRRTATIGALALFLAGPALAQQQAAPVATAMVPLKPADRTRIENLAASRDTALALAASGKAAELRAVKELLAAPAIPLDLPKLEGRWRCRSIQLGGISALTTNPFFACRIVRERDGLFLQKINGSLRRNARLVPLDEKRLLMYGAYWASGDKAAPYDTDDYRDEVGVLERLGPNRLRLELPEPRAFNSAKHDVIELVRHR